MPNSIVKRFCNSLSCVSYSYKFLDNKAHSFCKQRINHNNNTHNMITLPPTESETASSSNPPVSLRALCWWFPVCLPFPSASGCTPSPYTPYSQCTLPAPGGVHRPWRVQSVCLLVWSSGQPLITTSSTISRLAYSPAITFRHLGIFLVTTIFFFNLYAYLYCYLYDIF